MSAKTLSIVSLSLMLACGVTFAAQEEAPPAGNPAPAPAADQPREDVTETAKKALGEAEKQAEKIAGEVNRSPQAQKVTAGILQPIYALAEQLSFSWFYWLAFAVMATGVVSYALQLVLAKLVVLTKMGFSLSEILSDALGLVISAVGLVLTTQAAAENSTFTHSPASVLSATAVGVVCGFVFYRWGQAQEVQATLARRQAVRSGAK